MVRRTKSAISWTLLVSATLLGAGLIFGDAGTVQYLAFRSGLGAPVEIGGLKLHLKEGWYLKVSSEGLVGRFLVGSSEHPQATLAARDGAWGADSVRVAITRLSREAWEASLKSNQPQGSTEKFPWGDARIRDGDFVAEIPRYCLTVVVVDWRKGPNVRTVLDAITKIDSSSGVKALPAGGSATPAQCR